MVSSGILGYGQRLWYVIRETYAASRPHHLIVGGLGDLTVPGRSRRCIQRILFRFKEMSHSGRTGGHVFTAD